jgi:hypothetical protein
MRRHLATAFLVAALSPLAVAAPATAAPGNGAREYTVDRSCTSPKPGAVDCSSVVGKFNRVETPSGHVNAMDHATRTFTYTEPGIVEAGTERVRYKLLTKDGRDQVEHARSYVETTINEVSCTGRSNFLVVKGVIKKDTETFTCDGALP